MVQVTKPQRLERIARLIHEHRIHSQQELQQRLAHAGVEVTQATLSRDLQQLGVLKGAAGYMFPAQASGTVAAVVETLDHPRLQHTLRRELRGVEAAGNLVIVRTAAGHANALAVEIDRARPPEVLGTIAGDDTIFLAVRSGGGAARLARKFRMLTTNN
jgi:transcriptional regulator of arginine metabolism